MDKVHGKNHLRKILIDMKVNIQRIKNMVLDNLRGKQEANIEEIILAIKSRDLGKCFGATELFIKDFGIKEFKMDLV